MENVFVKFGVFVVGLALCWLVYFLFTRKSSRETAQRDAIIATGQKVWATLISKQPTGQSSGSNSYRLYAQQFYVLLELDVPQPNGTSSRCTIKCLPAPNWRPLQPGDQVQVYQKLNDPTRIALDTIMSPRYGPVNQPT